MNRQFAEALARRMHAEQKDKTGAPYIEHVERVARFVEQRVSDMVFGTEEAWRTDLDDYVSAAWLHDIVEDTTITIGTLLNLGFAGRTVRAVSLLTRMPEEPYESYIEGIALSGNRIATLVKWADLADHLNPNCPTSLRPRYEKALARLMRRTS